MKLLKVLFSIFVLTLLVNCSENTSIPDQNTSPPISNSIELTTIKIPTKLTLNCIEFTGALNGFIAAGSVYPNKESEILKTTDGGTTWKKVYSSSDFSINSISIKNNNEVFCVTDNGTILSSSNGGTTWNIDSRLKAKGYYMSSIKFTSNNEAYIVGQKGAKAHGFILKTIDNGLTWTDLEKENTNPNYNYEQLLENNHLTSITYFAPTNALIFSGGTWNNGKISIKNNDFWDVNTINEPVKFTDMAIKNDFLIAVGNNGQTNASTEKGAIHSYNSNTKIWKSIDYNSDNKLTNVAMAENTILIAGRNKSNNLTNGEYLAISIDNGKTWSRIPHKHVVAEWNDLHAINAKSFFAIGYKGLLVKITLK